MISDQVPSAFSSAVWIAAPLPRFSGWRTTLTESGQSPESSSSAVPSVEPSSTITSSSESTGRSASSTPRIASAWVARSL